MLTAEQLAERPWIGRNQFDGALLSERFLEKTRRDSSGCLIWIGAVNANGYGTLIVDGKIETASRVSYQLFVGPIPPGALIRHKCDVRACVEPAHLHPGSDADNRADCVARGRAHGAQGEKNVRAKLTADLVVQIRGFSDSTSVLAVRYGLNRTTTQRIRARSIWRHLS